MLFLPVLTKYIFSFLLAATATKEKKYAQPQVQVENNGNSLQPEVQVQVKENSEKRQEYDAIDSFTELLTTSRVDDDIFMMI